MNEFKTDEQLIQEITSELIQAREYLNNPNVKITDRFCKYIRFLSAKHNILLERLYEENNKDVEEIPLIKF